MSVDDPLQAVIRGRPVEQQRGTPTAIRRVRNWLDECDQHPECLPTEPILPSRVIDVGAEVGSPYVSLRETLDRTVEQYVALRYLLLAPNDRRDRQHETDLCYEAIVGEKHHNSRPRSPRFKTENVALRYLTYRKHTKMLFGLPKSLG